MEHKLPLKYSDPEGKGYCDALIPSECLQGANYKGLFRCSSGEIVTLKDCGTFNNTRGECDRQLDFLCQKMYNWTFSRVRSNWIARLGKVEDWWEHIKLYKVE